MLNADSLTKPSDDEKKLGDYILDAAGEQIKKQFDADTSLRVFEIDRGPLVKSALKAVNVDGATVNHRVHSYMVSEANENRWKLNVMGGDKGDKLVFAMKQRGRRKGKTANPEDNASPDATE